MANRMRLGDIATYINGYPFKPEERGTEGLPIIRIQDLTGNSYDLGFYNGEYPSRIEINDGDVLISWSGSLGVYVWARGKALLNQHIFKVVFDKVQVDKRYFVFAVQHKLREMEGKTHGATMKHIVKGDFDNTSIPFPSIMEQQEIAEVLSGVQSIIEVRQRQLRTLDTLIKARFVEMFEQDAYDEIEFGDVCEFLRNGANIKQTKGALGIPITRIETLANDIFNTDRLGYADIFELGKYSGYRLQAGDILISHINSIAYLGRAVQYRGQLGEAHIIHGMNLLCARIKPSFCPTFIEYFFKTPSAKEYISTITKKAVNQASITTTDLKKMRIPAPPIAKQEQFEQFVSQVDKSKVVNQQALDKTQLLFDKLMHQYFC